MAARLEGLSPLSPVVSGRPDGSWVTFVPGIGNDASFWAGQAERLERHHCILRFEPWGVGPSGPAPVDCTAEDAVEAVRQLWDRLGVGRSHVVGLGFGGSVALLLGLTDPHRVERIVACCCRPAQPEERRAFWRQRRETALSEGLDSLAAATVARWLPADFREANPGVAASLEASMKRSTPAAYAAYAGAFATMDFTERLSDLERPTLLVAGEHDHGGGPVEAMSEMASRIPGAVLEVVSGAGHLVVVEQPDRVADLLRNFLGP